MLLEFLHFQLIISQAQNSLCTPLAIPGAPLRGGWTPGWEPLAKSRLPATFVDLCGSTETLFKTTRLAQHNLN